MGKGFNLIIKIAKDVDRTNMRAKKERDRQHAKSIQLQNKQAREKEKAQKQHIQQQKRRSKIELELLKSKENQAFEQRCKQRNSAKQTIINSVIR